MADRSVSVDLVARVSGFVSGINTARTATRGFISELEKSEKRQRALKDLGNAAGIMGVAASAAFIGIVKSAANFDQAMSNVQAATHETSANMNLLRAAALKAGADTVYSATEAAGAVEELAKAGVSTTDILGGGLNGALSLAAAGSLEVGKAAEIAASAMTQFGLKGSSVPHIADLLAAGAGKAQGSVEDLGMALNQAGLIANQTGLSIEETTGGLAAFAKAGLTGSDAGTSFKTMLQSLTPRSAQAGQLMKDLNISAYDTQGNFIGLAKYAGVLQGALKGMSQQQQAATLKTIFGSDAVRAASVLYKDGQAGIQGWIDKVNDQGYAAETAATRLDNLSGDLEQLKGSLETAFIGTGESAQGPLRELVQMVTGLVNAYNELPGPVKTGALAIVGLTAVIGLGVFAVSRMIGAYVSLRSNLSVLGVSTKTAEGQVTRMSKAMLAARGAAFAVGAGLGVAAAATHDSNKELSGLLTVGAGVATGFAIGGPWGAAIGGAAGILGLFAQSSQEAAAKVDDLTATLDAQTGAVTENSFAWAAKELADRHMIGSTRDLGLSAGDVTKAMLDQGNSAKVLTDQLNAIIAAHQKMVTVGKEHTTSFVDDGTAAKARELLGVITNTNGTLDDAREKFKFTKQAADAAGDSAKSSGDKYHAMAINMQGAAKDAQKLTDNILKLNNAVLDNRGSMRDYEAAIDAARKSLKDHGKTLDIDTEKGRENQAALDDVARSAIAHAQAMKDDGQSVNAQRSFLINARKELVNTAQQFGMSQDAARNYASQVLKIPPRAATKVELEKAAAEQSLSEYVAKLNSRNGYTIHTYVVNSVLDRHLTSNHADGGFISGPGGPRDDRIPAMLSNGEFVVNAAATRRNLPLLHQINAQKFADGGQATADELRALQFDRRHFNVRPGSSASDVRSLVKDLLDDLRAAFGRDAPIVKHTAALGKRMVSLERAQDRATERYDKASDVLKSLRDSERQFASQVSSAFTHDAFGGSMADADLQFRADRNDARRAEKDLKRLRHHGVKGALFRQLAQSGNTQLLDELADASPRELRHFIHDFNSQQRATRHLGRQAGEAVFGKHIREQTKVVRHLDHTISRLDHRIAHLEHAVERGAHKGTKAGTEGRHRRAATARKAH